MNVTHSFNARPAMDGDGVNIRRVADFNLQRFDPYLMIDELKSNDEQDFIGGFPPHPHRGIETFTYILKGGFEHKDQLGNIKAIRSGDAQWMSTGSGVIHSEMPLTDNNEGLHGFQIWINMPAKDKMRPAQYQDTAGKAVPQIENSTGAVLKALAGQWTFAEHAEYVDGLLPDLAANGAIADVTLASQGVAELALSQHQTVNLYLYQGELSYQDKAGKETLATAGQLLILDSQTLLTLKATTAGAGFLLLAGTKISEKIVHHGPFVMNTQAEINQAISDYQQGKFGQIA
ncbi:pirin family protein [Shewanella sp. SR44-3]|uniref:pirin family protein n=1 Tax=Shewanella sp. SR44-3 TaxID=2760936 RepID=UPI0015F9092D|nr:pirin family protein [Shewanella sp. SR44-3]MBB1268908.1 pirin family protein [Shewanella sp. SR44-3]